MKTSEKQTRLYDLDWLRVLVFGLLILYHVGMFFAPWGWHIKNNELSGGLQYPMRFVNLWRLPILFMISGMGTWLALGKRSGAQYAAERVKRLLVPLIFGMMVIIPPQVYLERLVYDGYQGSYLSFLIRNAFHGLYPVGNISWHHLWFLPYLLLFSLILAPVFVYMKRYPANLWTKFLSKAMAHPTGMLVFILPLWLTKVLLQPRFPSTHALIGDWYNLALYFLLFFFGFSLMAAGRAFRESVLKNRLPYLLTGVLGIIAHILLRSHLPGFPGLISPLIRVVGYWFMILGLFGYAARYLNRESGLIRYCNKAVYPFYILHQTVTVILGYMVMDKSWHMGWKGLILIAGTFGICWLLYEFLIRRVPLLRPLFGVKP